MTDRLGKEAEAKISEWLNDKENGCMIYRIPDQMTGQKGSVNPCDFICYKHPFIYFIESKATWADRFDFVNITDNQLTKLLEYSQIYGARGLVIVLFASYKRAFMFDICEIQRRIEQGIKSINIKKIDKWDLKYSEIPTIANNRKKLLDYEGNIRLLADNCLH